MLQKITNGKKTKYVYGLGLIGEEKQNCGFKTYHYDLRGSTVAITDMSGNVTDTFVYDTYGKLTSRTGSTFVIFGYNGRDSVVTDVNGLIYMRARYYSPELRRFVNTYIVAGEITNGITLNRYAYANANPVTNVDPLGLMVRNRFAQTVHLKDEGGAPTKKVTTNTTQNQSSAQRHTTSNFFSEGINQIVSVNQQQNELNAYIQQKQAEIVIDFFDPDSLKAEGNFRNGLLFGAGSASAGNFDIDIIGKGKQTIASSEGETPFEGWLGMGAKANIANTEGTIGIGNELLSISLNGDLELISAGANAGISCSESWGARAEASASVAATETTIELNLLGLGIELGINADLLSAGAEANIGLTKSEDGRTKIGANAKTGLGWFGWGFILNVTLPF